MGTKRHTSKIIQCGRIPQRGILIGPLSDINAAIASITDRYSGGRGSRYRALTGRTGGQDRGTGSP
eukprot:scaffold460_cov31-Tisochrysis_lutea.AAC.4